MLVFINTLFLFFLLIVMVLLILSDLLVMH